MKLHFERLVAGAIRITDETGYELALYTAGEWCALVADLADNPTRLHQVAALHGVVLVDIPVEIQGP